MISRILFLLLYKYFEGENFHGFQGFSNNLKNFNLENFVLHYNSMLSFCNLQNVYHKNAQSHESTKKLTLKIFRLYGICDWILENRPCTHIWPIAFYWPS